MLLTAFESMPEEERAKREIQGIGDLLNQYTKEDLVHAAFNPEINEGRAIINVAIEDSDANPILRLFDEQLQKSEYRNLLIKDYSAPRQAYSGQVAETASVKPQTQPASRPKTPNPKNPTSSERLAKVDKTGGQIINEMNSGIDDIIPENFDPDLVPDFDSDIIPENFVDDVVDEDYFHSLGLVADDTAEAVHPANFIDDAVEHVEPQKVVKKLSEFEYRIKAAVIQGVDLAAEISQGAKSGAGTTKAIGSEVIGSTIKKVGGASTTKKIIEGLETARKIVSNTSTGEKVGYTLGGLAAVGFVTNSTRNKRRR